GEIERLVLELRHRERKAAPVDRAAGGVLFDLWTSGIRQADEFRYLVECFPDRVIAGAVEHRRSSALHVVNRRVPAGDHQRQKSRRQRSGRSLALKVRREDMALEMIDRDQ